LNHSFPAQVHAAATAGNPKRFCMNLSAPFICEFFTDQLDAAMPYVDVLFGNETECMALGRAKRLGDDIALVALATGQETNIFNKTSTCMSKRNSPRENDPSKNQSNRL
jgi:sugar/nucleoside kinase (ribokinase family)